MTFKVLLGIGIIIIIIIIIINIIIIILTVKVLWGIGKEFRSFFLIFEVVGVGGAICWVSLTPFVQVTFGSSCPIISIIRPDRC